MNHPFKQFLNDIRDDWRDDALCAQVSTGDEWFAEKGAGCVEQINYAKSVCQMCPVRVQCLDYALRAGEPFGVWGGLPPKVREQMRKDRNLHTKIRLEVADWHGTEAGARRHHREGTKLCQRCSEGAKRARREREQRGLAS